MLSGGDEYATADELPAGGSLRADGAVKSGVDGFGCEAGVPNVAAGSDDADRAPQLVQYSAPASRTDWHLVQRGASGALASSGALSACVTSVSFSVGFSGRRAPQLVQKTAPGPGVPLHFGQVIVWESLIA